MFFRVWESIRCFSANYKCVFMCLHWGEDWVWPNRHVSQIGKVLQWYLSYRFLPSAYMIIKLNWNDHQLLGHHTNQGPSPLVALLTSSRKSPGCFKLLSLRVTETTWFCEPSMKQKFFWTLPRMCGLTQTCFWSLQAVLFYLRACFLFWYAFSDVRPFIKTCVPFIPNQLNLPQIKFTWSLVTSTCNMNAPELDFNCPMRVWIVMQWNHFSFVFLIHLQRC